MRVYNKQIATNVVLNTSVTSEAEELKSIFMYSVCAIITGTPTGTIKLQASNDPLTNTSIPYVTPTNWVDIANSSFSLSAAGKTLWNVSDVAYNYVRVVYTDGSGGTSTAVMNIVINSKGA